MASPHPPSTPNPNPQSTSSPSSRPSSRHRSRRSHPSLPSFTVTPLKPEFPLPPTADDPFPTSTSQPQTPGSYLHASNSPTQLFFSPVSRSLASSRAGSRTGSRTHSRAPSRSSSKTRRAIRSALALTELDVDSVSNNGSNKEFSTSSKSTSYLPKLDTSSARLSSSSNASRTPGAVPLSAGSHAHHHRTRSIPKSVLSSSAVGTAREEGEGGSWLLHTAAVLATSTAESKGQLWLAARSESTSLVGTPYVEREGFDFGGAAAGVAAGLGEGVVGLDSRASTRRGSLALHSTGDPGKFVYAFAYSGGVVSRDGSRGGSRVGSKRGSRVSLRTPAGPRTPGEEETVRLGGPLGSLEGVGVDFVDEDAIEGEEEEDIEAEESELRKLVWGRVGGWVDWAVGWMDWREGLEGVLEEEDEKTEETGDPGIGGKTGQGEKEEEMVVKREQRRKKRRAELKYAETAALGSGKEKLVPAPMDEKGAGLLGDAGWLLGVARRALV